MGSRKRKNVGTSTVLSSDDNSHSQNTSENLVKRPRMRYSFEKKSEILKAWSTTSDAFIYEKYKLNVRTLRKWRKQKDQIIETAKLHCLKNAKKLSSCIDLDKALLVWLVDAQQKGLPMNGPIIKQKALNLNRELGGPNDFKASEGWLDKWKKRNNVRTLRITGEKLSADVEAADKYKEDFEKMVNSECLTRAQIFNFDESDLYFKHIPNTTLAPNSVTQGLGTKQQIERVTIAGCCNADGTFKLPLVLIGKSKDPRCLRNYNMKDLPVVYRHQQNAWIDKDIFQLWFEEDFVPKVRYFLQSRNLPLRAILIVENCKSHKLVKVGEIEVAFFPRDVTSLMQPLDQGILQCLKLNYQFHLVNSVLKAQRSGMTLIQHLKSITIREAIFWIAQSWEKLSQSTIYKCWNNLWPIKKCNAATQTDKAGTIPSLLDTSVGAESENPFPQNDNETFNELLRLIRSIKGCENVQEEQLSQFLTPIKP